MIRKPFLFVFLSLSCILNRPVDAQSLDESIAQHRKGLLTIRAEPGTEVTIKQVSHEFWFGAAIANGLGSGRMRPDDLEQYKKYFLENFNSAVTENALKWASMEPEKGQVNHQTVEGILQWTEENDIPLRGHNLFWGIDKFVQPWVKELSDAELESTIRERAISIARRYRGRFVEYDLNNEMIHGNYYEERLGPEITAKMARWVLEGDPEAKLYLNDYDILTGNRLNDYLAQIRDLLAQQVPIAGIGVQGHLHGSTFDRQALQASLDSLAQFGLPIRITEFNMPGQRSEFYKDTDRKMSPEEAFRNATELVDYYRICFAHPAVEGILMWGFWEGVNWIPASSLYTRDWQATPAARAYQNLIFDVWWTSTTGITDATGTLVIPAFYGDYQITADGQSKQISHQKAQQAKVVDFPGR
ncbi:Endo-1,4-beta-xylanase, GH35 family [Cyclobacterium lianum]|uniref:Beta-xylanase n=1 Tax=Cyclobacterium lianum TaxID=388280 RepID=A0A1M7LD30_9BACT|nr:endo-1,4-beta-xylanase [Cyclobacterium lianum]SHM75958.1 Endo-1,4-beta-xylanase, GH35 family [Cyclobacterium lianum]